MLSGVRYEVDVTCSACSSKPRSARIPQIIKNQRERSCDGLSLLFFMLSLLGNATYGAGVSTLIRLRFRTNVSRSFSIPSKRNI